MAIQVNKRMVEVYTTSDGKEYTDREWAEEHERMLAEKLEKTYEVLYYFTATYITRVQARDEDEAMEKAKEIDYPYPEDLGWELEEMEATEVQNAKN